MLLSAAIAWTELKLSAGGRSPKTIVTYMDCLASLERWLIATKRPLDITKWTDDLIDSYIMWLRTTPINADAVRDAEAKPKYRSETTVETYWRYLNAFLNRLVKHGKLKKNPMALCEKPKVNEVVINTFSDSDFYKLVDAARLGQQRLRDESMLFLLFDTGMRREELRSLRRDQIDFGQRMLWIKGKGRKIRWIAFSAQTAELLLSYDMEQRNQNCEVFFQTDGGAEMRQNGIYQIFKRIGRRSGVHANPHKFRHTFATSTLTQGANTLTVQRMLGHSKPDVTNRYFHMLPDHIKQAHEQYSPVKALDSRYRS